MPYSVIICTANVSLFIFQALLCEFVLYGKCLLLEILEGRMLSMIKGLKNWNTSMGQYWNINWFLHYWHVLGVLTNNWTVQINENVPVMTTTGTFWCGMQKVYCFVILKN